MYIVPDKIIAGDYLLFQTGNHQINIRVNSTKDWLDLMNSYKISHATDM